MQATVEPKHTSTPGDTSYKMPAYIGVSDVLQKRVDYDV